MTNRILKEFYKIINKEENIILKHFIKIYNNNNLYDFDILFVNDDTTYYINVKLNQYYPFQRPLIKFIERDGSDIPINPNIYPNGTICLKTINKWSPETKLIHVIKEICKILIEPNNKYMCNPNYYYNNL